MREAKTKSAEKKTILLRLLAAKKSKFSIYRSHRGLSDALRETKKKVPANAVEIDLTPSPPKIRNTPQNTPYNKPNSQAKNPQEWREVNTLDKGKVLKFLTKMISSLGTSSVINVPGYYLTAEKRPGI